MDAGWVILGGLTLLGIASNSKSQTSTSSPIKITASELTVDSIVLPSGNGIDSSGDLTIANVSASGSVTSASLTVSGPLSSKSLTVTNGSTVSGGVVADSLTLSGPAYLGSTLSVTGATSLQSSLTVSGKASFTSLSMPLNGASAGAVLTADANGNGTWQAATGGGGGGTVATPNVFYFGDTTNTSVGADTLIISSSQKSNSPYTMQADEYHKNLTIASDGIIYTNGFRLHVWGTFDISQAKTNSIAVVNPVSIKGGKGSNNAGGLQGSLVVGGTIGGGSADSGFNGAAGLTAPGNGSAVINGTNSSSPYLNGGAGGTAGAGGAAGVYSGGTLSGKSHRTVAPAMPYFTYERDFLPLGVPVVGGQVGYGGGGGAAADNTVSAESGGGGGGGAGGGILWIAANTIVKSSSTQAGAISVAGGVGGQGGDALYLGGSGDLAGGGGGGGGGGGWAYIVYNTLSGPQVTNLVNIAGGLGGAGGNFLGAGSPGVAGSPGGSGRATLINLSTGIVTDTGVGVVSSASL